MHENTVSPQEKEAKEFAIQARKEIAVEEEKLDRIRNPLQAIPGNKDWPAINKQEQHIWKLDQDAKNHIKDVVKDLPKEQQVEIEKYTDRVLRGGLDKELGIGKHAPGRSLEKNQEKTIEQPNRTAEKNKEDGPER